MDRPLLAKTTGVLLLGTTLIVFCYYFVDQPVAWFFFEHRFFPTELRDWPPAISEVLKFTAAAGIVGVFAWRMWRRAGPRQTFWMAIAADLVVVTVLKQLSKWLCGRYGPETWKEGIDSLISTGVYGFNPFHAGQPYEAFPSGHTAVVCSVAAILWITHPHRRRLIVGICVAVMASLIVMNYHFVGDVIAGAILGGLTGVYVARWFALSPMTLPASAAPEAKLEQCEL